MLRWLKCPFKFTYDNILEFYVICGIALQRAHKPSSWAIPGPQAKVWGLPLAQQYHKPLTAFEKWCFYLLCDEIGNAGIISNETSVAFHKLHLTPKTI